MGKSIILIAVCIIIGVAGQVLLKSGMTQVGRIDSNSIGEPLKIISKIVNTPVIPIGFSLYIIGSILWLIVLSRENLSFAYPFLGFTYVLMVAISKFFLGESVSSLRWIGAAIVSIGVFLITKT